MDAKILLRLVCPVGFGQGRRCLPVVCQFNPTVRGGDIHGKGGSAAKILFCLNHVSNTRIPPNIPDIFQNSIGSSRGTHPIHRGVEYGHILYYDVHSSVG